MYEHRPSVTGPKTIDGEELLELLNPPSWHADGLCKEPAYPAEWWFDGPVEAARAVCGRCLVQSECRDYAVARPRLQGVWGGMSESDRVRLRAAARRKAA